MKKFLSIAFLAAGLFFAGQVNAQHVHVGYSPESWSGSKTVDLNSFFIGVDYNMPVSGALNLAVGGQLRYGNESGESNFYGLGSGKHTTTLVGVEVPILLNYSFSPNKDLSFTLFAGPKLSYYVVGTTKYEGNVLGILGGSSEVEWFKNDGLDLNLKPFNVSATFGLAIGFQKIQLFGGYNYGLLDVDNNDDTETNINGPFFGLGFSL